jgi:hypothetical protein
VGANTITWVVMGALEVTALSAVAGSRTVSLMGFVVWKSCCRHASGWHQHLATPVMLHTRRTGYVANSMRQRTNTGCGIHVCSSDDK